MSDGLRHAYTFCPQCAQRMGIVHEGGEQRPACPACGFVQYLNPSPAAAVVVKRGRKVCLVKRKFPPREGQWTLPAGFMEYDETPRQTAVREALEETGLVVEIASLRSVHQGILPPDRPVVLVVFDALETGGVLAAGDDAADVGFFDLEDLPGPIAFAAHREVLGSLAGGED
jgi:8-oxo-dGTP diphosphatase